MMSEEEELEIPELEAEEVPELTGNIINIIGNSFSAVTHANDPQLKDDIRFARQKAVEAVIPEIEDYGLWCQFKHVCTIIVNLHEQACKDQRKGNPTEGVREAIGLYRKIAEILWIGMLTGNLEYAREQVTGE